MRSFGFNWAFLPRLVAFSSLLLTFTYISYADFWSSLNKGQPETAKLMRKLPAVAARSGSTVRFQSEIAGSSIPAETATILREKIRTLLLHNKTGEIQLVDGPADTEIKCIVTSYEPKIVRPAQRRVGSTVQKIDTWIGNIGASVQVLDSRDHPIDAANLKNHLENDFILSQTQASAPAVAAPPTVFGKKLQWPSKVPGSSIFKPSVSPSNGSDQSTTDALNKSGRPPTDVEWREALIEGLAAKVANRIVPIDDEFVVVLPVDKDFQQIREFAKTGHWGNVQESSDKMGTLNGGKEADRLYMLGLSYEASAYAESAKPDDATRALNTASELYAKASQIKPDEHELLLSKLRVQDAVDHYEAIQQFLHSHAGGKNTPTFVTQAATSDESTRSGAADVADNAAIIEMARNNMPEAVILTYIKEAKAPKFDASSGGLIALMKAKVPGSVIQAIQSKMSSGNTAGTQVGTPPAARVSKTGNRKVPAPVPVQ